MGLDPRNLPFKVYAISSVSKTRYGEMAVINICLFSMNNGPYTKRDSFEKHLTEIGPIFVCVEVHETYKLGEGCH